MSAEEEYTMTWDDGSTAPVLNYKGLGILAVEIRKDKSLREIAKTLGVDIEIVKRTVEEVLEAFEFQGVTGPTINKLKRALEELIPTFL